MGSSPHLFEARTPKARLRAPCSIVALPGHRAPLRGGPTCAGRHRGGSHARAGLPPSRPCGSPRRGPPATPKDRGGPEVEMGFGLIPVGGPRRTPVRRNSVGSWPLLGLPVARSENRAPRRPRFGSPGAPRPLDRVASQIEGHFRAFLFRRVRGVRRPLPVGGLCSCLSAGLSGTECQSGSGISSRENLNRFQFTSGRSH
jgi:hypothetical protein